MTRAERIERMITWCEATVDKIAEANALGMQVPHNVVLQAMQTLSELYIAQALLEEKNGP